MHLAVALDGAGWHPAAWREPAARPADLFNARYWTDLVTEAERGLLDLVTIEDAFSLQPGGTGAVRGRLDAVLIAARLGPVTRHVGLVPTVIATHTEPFHIAKAIATLDYVSKGRAGVRIKVSADPVEYAHVGRRNVDTDGLFEEAADYVEVLRRLWDSWEDDAEIRDVTTGRFVDRDKLHYIDFEGRFFSVKGPSITPRPPQGQPVVAALAHGEPAYAFAERSADVTFVTPKDAADAASIVGRLPDGGHVFGDLVVLLGATAQEAEARAQRLGDFASDAGLFVGTPEKLADQVTDWHHAGLSGVRLRPAVLPDDLTAVTRGLVPELQRRGLFRTSYEADTLPTSLPRASGPGKNTASPERLRRSHPLRGLLGLPRPENRYAGTVSS
jgi:alkanesulfonate monooxygenase SsuD/methylene tetrahydromethanopterin reductase-like flavin-dependent oxidoreductase (luciferase family)